MAWSRIVSVPVLPGIVVLALAAAPHPAASAPSPVAAASAPTADRTLRDARITESSGLALSRRFGGVVYTHNDKGDSARVFAVGRNGTTRALLRLTGVDAQDWEDIASGPNNTVWVGDIGDNTQSRREIAVFRFKEPTKLVSQDVSWTRFRLAYPDGAHDAEALLVNPQSGRVLVVSKSASGASVYRAPSKLSPKGVNRLTRIGGAPPLVTAGDFARTGGRLVLRAYDLAYVYSRLGARPRVVRLPTQRQGESITFGPGGKALLIGTEGASSKVIHVPL